MTDAFWSTALRSKRASLSAFSAVVRAEGAGSYRRREERGFEAMCARSFAGSTRAGFFMSRCPVCRMRGDLPT